MSTIKDGQGSARLAGVDKNNRLKTNSVVSPAQEDINHDTGKVWSIPFEDIDPTGADDYFIYIKNDGTVDLSLTTISVSSTVAGQLEIQKVSGTASGGSDITLVSKNLGKSVTPTATIQSGSDITGLTNDGILEFLQLDVALRNYFYVPPSHIIISPGQSLALLWEPGTGILTGTVTILEE